MEPRPGDLEWERAEAAKRRHRQMLSNRARIILADRWDATREVLFDAIGLAYPALPPEERGHVLELALEIQRTERPRLDPRQITQRSRPVDLEETVPFIRDFTDPLAWIDDLQPQGGAPAREPVPEQVEAPMPAAPSPRKYSRQDRDQVLTEFRRVLQEDPARGQAELRKHALEQLGIEIPKGTMYGLIQAAVSRRPKRVAEPGALDRDAEQVPQPEPEIVGGDPIPPAPDLEASVPSPHNAPTEGTGMRDAIAIAEAVIELAILAADRLQVEGEARKQWIADQVMVSLRKAEAHHDAIPDRLEPLAFRALEWSLDWMIDAVESRLEVAR